LNVSRLIFPGDRRVWLWSLAIAIPIGALIGYSVARPRTYYTGTDSVGVRSIVASVKQDQKLCIPDLLFPGGTGAVQLSYGVVGGPPPTVSLTLVSAGRLLATGSVSGAHPPPPAHVTLPLSQVLARQPVVTKGTLCVRVGRGGTAQFGGFAGLPTDLSPPTVAGRPLKNASIALWFLPPGGQKASIASEWSKIMQRLAVFRPGFAGRIFYWILFVAVLPLLAYLSVRLLAVAGERRRRLGLTLAVIAFLSAGSWAITTAAFDSPDESEHFAYTESLAEAGRAPAKVPVGRQAYATDEIFALDAVHHFSSIEVGDARPPWFSADQRAWQARVRTQHPSRSDGGGYSIATAPHSPLYYGLLIPGYEIGRSGGIFSELFWMRLESALFGALVALLAYATIRELLPSRPELAVAGGLLIAFQPMFAFISASVNNDNGVNVAAALAVYLTVRILRRGLSWRLALALAVTCATMPLMKATGLALYPAIGLALVVALLGKRSRITFRSIAIAAGGFVSVALAWVLLASSFGRSVIPLPPGTGVGGGQLGGKLTYIWEAFLPRLPFMSAHFASNFWPFSFIYVHRGFGAFGWYAIFFPNWVYHVILAVLAAAIVLVLASAWRRRELVRWRWREALFLVLVVVLVFLGVELAFYSPGPRPINFTPEQGRYAFTAAVAFAAIFAAGMAGLSRGKSRAVAAVAVSAMIGLNLASHLLYVSHTFM
jgi:hypothetical protein